LLAEQPGKLRTKQELLDGIWPDTAVEEATLGRHISDLRRVLGNDQRYIQTVTRHGYRFLGEARAVEESRLKAAAGYIGRPTRRIFGRVLGVCVVGLLCYAGIRLIPESTVTAKIPDEPGVIRLTNNVASDGQPDWSPDGKRIAFQRKRGTQPEIFVMNADGREPRAPGVFGARASWAPDSSELAFQCYDGKVEQICAVRADGSDFHTLTHLSDFSGDPNWSPDGKSIIFTHRDEGHLAIWRMDAGGGNARGIYGGAGDNAVAVWSPDGARIAFTNNRSGKAQIYVVDADGTNFRMVNTGPGRAAKPAWSPDGTRIVFESDRDGNDEIYIASFEAEFPLAMDEQCGGG
jgi:Tol biopolymer transport system component